MCIIILKKNKINKKQTNKQIIGKIRDHAHLSVRVTIMMCNARATEGIRLQ